MNDADQGIIDDRKAVYPGVNRYSDEADRKERSKGLD